MSLMKLTEFRTGRTWLLCWEHRWATLQGRFYPHKLPRDYSRSCQVPLLSWTAVITQRLVVDCHQCIERCLSIVIC